MGSVVPSINPNCVCDSSDDDYQELNQEIIRIKETLHDIKDRIRENKKEALDSMDSHILSTNMMNSEKMSQLQNKIEKIEQHMQNMYDKIEGKIEILELKQTRCYSH